MLCSMSLPMTRKYASAHLGRLITPRHIGSVQRTIDLGILVAADCDGYNGTNAAKYEHMLDHLAGMDLAFVVVPDKREDAAATRALWDEWAPRVRAHGLRLAYVLQDGETIDAVPWTELDAVFVGGSTRWKLGAEARALVREAKRRGKYVHMGRVNTLSRLRYAFRLGCDSVDGSAWAKFSDTKLPRALRLLDRLHATRASGRATRLDTFPEQPATAGGPA